MDAFHKLTACLGKLPGIGRRSAERIAMKLVRDSEELLPGLIQALAEVRRNVRCCSQCGSITPAGEDPCRLCTSDGRDKAVLCVVEEPNDILTIERSGAFHGRYHALMGKLSPGRGEGPAELRIQALLKRVDSEKFTEVILALSTDVEGDATASYITELLKSKPVKVSRLAFGLPVGSGVAYADPATLAKALKGRQEA